jgi:flagellar motor switch protein FliM
MLSHAEIDALLGAVSAPATEFMLAPGTTHGASAPPNQPARPIKTYDFRRPDKFSKDQLRTLQAIHDNVARLASARLSARLRTTITMQLAGAEQMVFDEYLQQVALPTQLAVMSSSALAGPFLVDLDLGLAYACIDRILGGPGRLPDERREPTSIESQLVGRVLSDILPAFHEAWGHLAPFDVAVTETALSPALLRVAAPTDVVAVLTLEVRIAGQTAPLAVCYPHAALEPMIPKLSATAWYAQPDRGAAAEAHVTSLRRSLETVELHAAATLGTAELPVEVLAELVAGDVIRLDERVDRPVLLSIEDQVRAWALPGRVNDRLALELVAPLHLVED